jgi:hypothetical protein
MFIIYGMPKGTLKTELGTTAKPGVGSIQNVCMGRDRIYKLQD